MNRRSVPADAIAAFVVAAGLAAGLTGEWAGARLVLGLGLAAVATASWRRRPGAAVIAAAAGGWFVSDAALRDGQPGWQVALGVAALVAVTAGVGRRPVAVTRRVVLCCLAGSCMGVFLCVPETDGPGRLGLVVGVGASVAAAFDLDVSDLVIGAAAATLLFAALSGGQYRASAVVGGVGSMGILAVGALVPGGSRATQVRMPLATESVLVVLHGVGVLAASLVAGRGDGLVRPVLLAGAVGVALLIALTVTVNRCVTRNVARAR